MSRIKEFWRQPILQNQVFLLSVWLGVAFIAFLFILLNHGVHNNYIIFSHSLSHALSQQPLYIQYPKEYDDLFLYGIPFTGLIAPFALLPDALGALLWCLATSFLLYWSIKQLDLGQSKFAFVILFSLNELYTVVSAHQYNIGVAALIIFTFVLIEKKKDFWAALILVLGVFTKVYGIVGLAFFFFSKKKSHFIGGLLFWGVIVFAFPMLYSSPQYVIDQYGEWLYILFYKNELNQFCGYTNISLLGLIRKITHIASYSDLWVIVIGLILFSIPYLRVSQYRYKSFRLLYLSSTLLFMVLFSTGTETSGYIAAIIAVAIWYQNTPTRYRMRTFNTGLLIFCFILTSLGTTDFIPLSIRTTYVTPYALKALPCVLIWLKIVWEQSTVDFSEKLRP